MTPDLYRPDVPESPPVNHSARPYRPERVTLTKEQKKRAARRSNYAGLPLAMLMTFTVVSTQAWGLLLVFLPLMLIVNLCTWLFFLRVERIMAERKLGLW